MQIEDLASARRRGWKIRRRGNLISGVGKLPFNTDGAACAAIIRSTARHDQDHRTVRQLRGEAHPKVQCRTAILPSPMVPADCRRASRRLNLHSGARVMAMQERSQEISGAARQSRNQTVLGRRSARQVPDQALHGLRRAALFSALGLPVLLFRQDVWEESPAKARSIRSA